MPIKFVSNTCWPIRLRISNDVFPSYIPETVRVDSEDLYTLIFFKTPLSILNTSFDEVCI